MIDPFKHGFGIDKVINRPLHHGFIAHRNRLNNIGVLVGHGNRSVYLAGIVVDITSVMINKGITIPGIFFFIPHASFPGIVRLDPGTDHQIHLKVWILCF